MRFVSLLLSLQLYTSVTDAIKPSMTCGARLDFAFNSTVPFNIRLIDDTDVVPMQVPNGCQETQHCLFFPDDDLANLMLAAETSIFPTGENMYSKHSPKDAREVLANVEVLFDEQSTFYIHQLGQYTGPSAIASYMSVPHSAVSDIGYRGIEEVLELNYRIKDSALTSSFVRVEQWTHLDFREEKVIWTFDSKRYPCSAMIQRWELELPRFTVENFAISSRLPGTVDRMCERVLSGCHGPYEQFNGSLATCKEYYNSLPDHDPTCQPVFGEFAGQGESLFCKYLHQWMAPLEPQLHCFHAGTPAPDVNGRLKCAPSECAPQSENHDEEAVCRQQDLEELAAAAVYTLPFCLPSLSSASSCADTNCTHAINTYLGRFVANGVVCACSHRALPSRMLTLLELDAGVLLRHCGAESGLFSLPSCVTGGGSVSPPSAIQDCSHDPGLYVAKGGCRAWDWQRLESGLLRDWARRKFRETPSEVVAAAECDVYQKLFKLYYGLDGHVQLDGHVASYFVSREAVFPLPDGARMLRTHAEVVDALRAPQFRSNESWIFGLCFKGSWNMILPETGPITENDGAPRRAMKEVLGGVYRGMAADTVSVDPAASRALDPEDDDELRKHFFVEALRAAIGSERMRRFEASEFEERARDFAEVVWVGFRNKHNLRATGNMWAALYKLRQRNLMELFREAFPSSELDSLLTQTGTASLFTADQVIDNAVPNALSAVLDLASNVWTLLRREPCRMLPVWDRSPTRFVLEASRLFSPAVAPRVRLHSADADPVIVDIPAANYDPTVFPDPYTFDPTRDLSRIVSFNMLEGEYQHAIPGPHHGAPHPDGATNSTVKRGCPARGFAVKAVRGMLEPLLPTARARKCSRQVSEFHGVKFRREMVAVEGGADTMVVFKTVREDETALVVALHGFPSTPQEWARVQSHLQTGDGLADGLRGLAGSPVFGMWSVALPGWAGSSHLTNCTLESAAVRVEEIVRMAVAEGRWSRVYLAGHGLGGLIAWATEKRLPRGLIDGLVSVGAAHPGSQALPLRGMDVRKAPFRPFLGSMADGLVAANDFEALVEAMEEEDWWDSAWKHEHVAVWKQTGGKALNCYYQDNFKVFQGAISPQGLEAIAQDPLHTNVLLVGSELDAFTPAPLLQHSMQWMTGEREYGVLLQYHHLHHTGHYEMLHDEHASKQIAMQMLSFDQRVQRIQFSMWSRLQAPAVLSTSSVDLTSYAVPIGVYGACLMVAFGVALEQYLGPILTAAENGEALWRLAQIAAGVLTFAIGTSAPMWVGIPLFSAAIFHFGFPQLKTKMSKRSSVFRGVAGFTHHAGVCLGYMCFSLGMTSLAQDLVHPMHGLMMFIPLTLQHTLGIIKYHAPTLHAFLLVGLEVWLQLEALFIFPILDGMSAVSLWMMIVSHWCLFLHGSYVFCQGLYRRKTDDDDDEDAAAEVISGGLGPVQQGYTGDESIHSQFSIVSSMPAGSDSVQMVHGSSDNRRPALQRKFASKKSFRRMRANAQGSPAAALRSPDLSPDTDLSRPASHGEVARRAQSAPFSMTAPALMSGGGRQAKPAGGSLHSTGSRRGLLQGALGWLSKSGRESTGAPPAEREQPDGVSHEQSRCQVSTVVEQGSPLYSSFPADLVTVSSISPPDDAARGEAVCRSDQEVIEATGLEAADGRWQVDSLPSHESARAPLSLSVVPSSARAERPASKGQLGPSASDAISPA